MRRAHDLASLLPVLALTALTAGCSPSPTGELIVVLQSDLSLPKDISVLRLEIRSAGETYHDWDYNGLGKKGSLLFPATIGIVASDEPSQTVSIRVTARTGTDRRAEDSQARVLREVTTTVPQDRIATLHVPVQFLCDGSGENHGVGDAKNAECGEGKTCLAGQCVPIDVSSTDLPTYDQGDVFGGGTGQQDGSCFDVTKCMEGGALTLPEPAGEECTLAVDPGAGDVNVAIVTEVDGICGSESCLVALDAGSTSGWVRAKDAPEKLVVPAKVCEKLGSQVRGLYTAPLKPGCPLKTVGTPTCGPWSAVGPPQVVKNEPVARASGQHRPTAIAVNTGNPSVVFWTSAGLFEQGASTQETAGGVSSTFVNELNGTGVQPIDDALSGMSARDVVFANGFLYWTVADVAKGNGSIRRWTMKDGEEPTSIPTESAPEGLAVTTDRVLWTEFTAGHIKVLSVNGGDMATLVEGDPTKRPARIAADDKYACWTNEGVGTTATGSIECYDFTASPGQNVSQMASGLAIPRAIALDEKGLYWATFDKDGALYMASRGADRAFVSGSVVAIAKGQAFPNGIAVDADFIYWTNWGDGTVWRVKKSPLGAPEKIASGQRKPGEIAIAGSHIVWVNEGESVSAGGDAIGSGAVIKLAMEGLPKP